MTNKLKIVSIICTPHIDGNTATLCQNIIDDITGDYPIEDVYIKHYNLHFENIAFCNDCGICKIYKKCKTDDAVTEICEEIKTADYVLMGAPIYFGSLPAPMKAFIDRLNSVWQVNRMEKNDSLENCPKFIGFLTSGGNDERDFKGAERLLRLTANVLKLDFINIIKKTNTDRNW